MQSNELNQVYNFPLFESSLQDGNRSGGLSSSKNQTGNKPNLKKALKNNETQPAGSEYVVESILDRKIVKGKTKYFIKWYGYDASYNTWEPLRNLTHCKKMLKNFEEKLEQSLIAQQKKKG